MVTEFSDPKGFVGESVFAYIDSRRKPARIKSLPLEFMVLEPAYGRPGVFLSVGHNSDYPDGAVNFPYGNCPSGQETTAMPWYGFAPVAPGVTADRCTAAILSVNDGTTVDHALMSLASKLGLDSSRIRHRLLPNNDQGSNQRVELVVEGYNPEDMKRRVLGEEPFTVSDMRSEDPGSTHESVWCVVTARSGVNLDEAIKRLTVKLRLEPHMVTWRRIGKVKKQNGPGPRPVEKVELCARGISQEEFKRRLSDHEPYCVEHSRYAFMVICTLMKERLTTMAAIDWLCATLSKLLGREIKSRRVSNSGLKDRWAVTAQHIVIEGATVEEITRCIALMPLYSEGRAGLALKDARFAYDRLYKGDHGTNRFKIIVRSDMTAEEIERYLKPRLEKLRRRGMWIPNAFGRQRLGRRQNLHVVGRTLVTNDFNAPNGVHPFGSASEAAAYRFLFDTTGSEPAEVSSIRRQAEGMWLYNFRDMKQLFEQHYRQRNLAFEFKMADRLADDRYGGSFENVIDSMWDECSLFVAAWQSWWWNLVLAKKLYGWVKAMDQASTSRDRKDGTACTCEGNGHECQDDESTSECKACKCARCSQWVPSFNPGKKCIPILMATPQARTYYGRLQYAQDAVRELGKADADVREMFLLPRNRRDGSLKEFGPWRKAFIRVENQKSSIRDGVWEVQFDLRSGAYATTYLLLLWDLIDPEDVLQKPEAGSFNDVEEITD